MNSGIILYIISGILVSISFIKDPKKTKQALLMAWKMFRKLLPEVLAIMSFVGLSLSILTPSLISSIVGKESGIIGVIISTIIGSITLFPSFIVFPLGKTLVNNGAGLTQVAVLMSTLMSVGIVTLPMEQMVFQYPNLSL